MKFLPLLLLFFAACSGDSAPEQAQQSSSNQAAPRQASFAGLVTESMNAGGYTYARIEKAGESIWAAAPETEVEVGQLLTVSTAMPMENFHSETLDRTFDVVYFVQDFEEKPDMPKHPEPGAARADVSVEPGEGELAVAAVWAQRDELEGSQVQLRGKVVKYNANIMSRNWIHIQDGSGDEGAKTHDLAVTTQDEVAVGDMVIVRGKVGLDRDFGAGYTYEVILEEASITPLGH